MTRRSLSFYLGLLAFCALQEVEGALVPHSRESRRGRQDEDVGIVGGIDFSNAVLDPETGLRCVIEESSVETLLREPILECKHKEVEKCHYTYVTQFVASQEEVCDESFEKTCQITFKQQAVNETIKKCYRPLIKSCNGQGEDICRTMFESACSTKYIEKQPGKFVGDTRCEKQPIEVCGAGCVAEEGDEECHDKTITQLIDIPEETCELNPQTTCKLATKLVPELKAKPECTVVPQEMCHMTFTTPKLDRKPLQTKWCLDETPPTPDALYPDSERDSGTQRVPSTQRESGTPRDPERQGPNDELEPPLPQYGVNRIR